MAERRMFSKKIVNSARFLRLSAGARLLYYDLGIAADDDGIVEAYTVIQMTRACEADLWVLERAGFVKVLTDDLVTLIQDWKVNNLIKKDRYSPSIYLCLLNENRRVPNRNPNGTQMEPQSSLGQDSLGQDSLGQDSLGQDSLGQDSLGQSRSVTAAKPPADDDDSTTNEKKVYSRFTDAFGTQPSREFKAGIRSLLADGFPTSDMLEVIDKASKRSPKHPSAYVLQAIRSHTPRFVGQVAEEQAAQLADWEKDWLEDMKARKAARKREEQEGEHENRR